MRNPPDVTLPVAEFASGEDLARAGAEFIAERARRAVAARGEFTLAVSGGRGPRRIWEVLATLDVPWRDVTIFQVDERVAPRGDDERNLTQLSQSLASRAPRVVAMPVDDPDLALAARRYGALLPAHLDLVHLGLGPDGHTASLVPGDPVLDVADQPVAATGEYQGRRRMTLTFAGLERAEEIVWIVSGEDTRAALRRLVDGDATIPAGRVRRERSWVLTDLAGL